MNKINKPILLMILSLLLAAGTAGTALAQTALPPGEAERPSPVCFLRRGTVNGSP